MYILRIFPIQKNKILFISYYGKYYNDNPMMISRKLENRRDIDIVWAVNQGVKCPDTVRSVRMSSFRYLYELATAKVWVDNSRKYIWTKKRKEQYYIQTWHGNLGNKKIEGAAIENLPKDYILRAKSDAIMTDLMISGSSFFTDLIKKYFWYDGEIMECGTPRLDSFFQMSEETRSQTIDRLGLKNVQKVVLYAPTFRSNFETDCYKLDCERILETLEKKDGNRWAMLVRLHPNIAEKADCIHYSERIINATNYPDLYELIPIADILISDYSSLTFEAGLIDKPVFLFATDLEKYICERGFYIDIREQPYVLAESNDELVERIISFNKEKYMEKLLAFNANLGIKENGNAAEQIADRILKVIEKE